MIAPMRQGQRLTRRSALKVVLSRELPRSAGSPGGRVQQVDGALIVGQPATAGMLDRDGQRRALALVAQVAQHGVGLVGPLGRQRQCLGVGAQDGGVVLAAGPHS